jgi:hypothetical protein
VLSSPWSLEFVLAVIIGAMLVPGCRADKGALECVAVSTAGPVSSAQAGRPGLSCR